MGQLVCSGCGAPMSLPADHSLDHMVCEFCGVRTPLPGDLLRARVQERREERQQAIVTERQEEAKVVVRNVTSFVKWIVIVSVVLPLIITVVVMIFVARVTSHVIPTASPSHHGH